MLRPQRANLDFEASRARLFGFRVVALPDQGSGKIGLGIPSVLGVFRSEDANLGLKRFPLQFFRFVDVALP